MPLAFGTTISDGPYLKVFTVTALDNDGAADFAVAFDGLLGRPTPFAQDVLRPLAAPLRVDVVRVDTGAAGQQGGASEFGYHTATAAGLTIRKLTASGAGANTVTVRVMVDAVQSVGR